MRLQNGSIKGKQVKQKVFEENRVKNFKMIRSKKRTSEQSVIMVSEQNYHV